MCCFAPVFFFFFSPFSYIHVYMCTDAPPHLHSAIGLLVKNSPCRKRRAVWCVAQRCRPLISSHSTWSFYLLSLVAWAESNTFFYFFTFHLGRRALWSTLAPCLMLLLLALTRDSIGNNRPIAQVKVCAFFGPVRFGSFRLLSVRLSNPSKGRAKVRRKERKKRFFFFFYRDCWLVFIEIAVQDVDVLKCRQQEPSQNVINRFALWLGAGWPFFLFLFLYLICCLVLSLVLGVYTHTHRHTHLVGC